MSHAAHKAPKGTANGTGRRSGLLGVRTSSNSTHTTHAVHTSHKAAHPSRFESQGVQLAANGGAVVDLDAEALGRINAPAPRSRRAIREARKAQTRRSRLVTSVSLAALVGMTTTATMAISSKPKDIGAADDGETTITRAVGSSAASRSEDRTPLSDTKVSGKTAQTMSDGSWQLGQDSSVDVSQMSKSAASNPAVAALMDNDQGQIPAGFNPNHATGDTGNGYEFSQCTWWVYVRRHQLGLPVGSHMGNGNMWGNSARALGYWVDHSARHTGDVMVFAAGQDGSDPIYGHVAVIEKVNPDGSVVTSECGSVMNGKTYSHTYSASQVAQHDIIHY